jgi:type VI secretion system secreted protein VgrG
MAGKNWGTVAHPRIGQEVIVEFLEGDPDRPLVTGRVYNAEHMPPYDLPAQRTKSGIKTRSAKAGSSENFNEIRFEDKKGSEEFYVHAERELRTVVEAAENHETGEKRTTKIGNGDELTVSSGDATLKVSSGGRSVTVPAGKYEVSALSVAVKATTELSLECGPGKISIDSAGIITIQGTMVKVN